MNNEAPLVGGGETLLPADCTFGGAPLASQTGAFGIVTVTNSSTTKTVDISVWTSQDPGGPVLDTAITSYTTAPTNTASYKKCTNTVTDTCDDMTDPTSCLGNYGGLMLTDGNDILIPKGGSVYIFVQDQYSGPGDFGTIKVTVRTEGFM